MQEELIEEVEEYFEEVAMVEEEPIEEIPNEIEGDNPSSDRDCCRRTSTYRRDCPTRRDDRGAS